ncbi:serine/threonine-protein kinase [Botrimarina mediterranea]|uniref:non-specific serine/threonine protein kinase n=1 Tax=Botrimarina mediterranea TaxID=2528022 RepID=A0A518KBR5_9BACT|nr:serine/threonine-protein kinase [Botrimarina mediterranea]QDV75225.1 Serine/threonine-protein kinase PknB [Botrimarina mediterranea]QDV79894.1 Serine/threonine-protein kinase PknB [Planctomycetes bacterium K2D]
MPTPTQPLDVLAAIDAVCDRYEAAWREAAGADGPRCEDFAAELPEAELPEGLRLEALRELFQIERQYRAVRGEQAADWAVGRPAIEALLNESLADAATLTGRGVTPSSSGALQLRCPQCQSRVGLPVDAQLDDITCQACGSSFGLLSEGPNADITAPRVGRFALRQRLGVGGFGAVWRARDPELDRDVALKLPRRGGLAPHEAELFFREARAAAQLAHPGIVSVYEVGRDTGPEGTGSIYIVSELVDGEPLSERIKEWRPAPRQAAAIVADIAEALDYAHSRGVIHRDLKPSNVMLDRFASGGETARVGLTEIGRPRLMDFGLAKRDAGEVTMTMDGQVLGTPAYMSPEQASGNARWIDRRTDVYSLGVVLFRLLTGELPFRGTATSQIQQRITDDAPSPRRLDDSVPMDLATVCLKCLERDPGGRYATAADVAAEMRRYLAGEPVLARPLSVWGRAGRWARRRPALAAALVLGAVLAIVGPTAAVVIGRQATKLESQLDERDELIAQQEKRVDELEAAKDAEGVRVRGHDIDPIRVAAIERLLTNDGERLMATTQQLPVKTAGGIKARIAMARLLLAVGRDAEAAMLLSEIGEPSTAQLSKELTQLREALSKAEALRDAVREERLGAAGVKAARQLRDVTTPQLPAGNLTPSDIVALAEVLLEQEQGRLPLPSREGLGEGLDRP